MRIITTTDVQAIRGIVERGAALMEKASGRRLSATDKSGWRMTISAVHSGPCPLRLPELLVADDLNFAHDVFGIMRHFNRREGKLEHCFVPRYAARGG